MIICFFKEKTANDATIFYAILLGRFRHAGQVSPNDCQTPVHLSSNIQIQISVAALSNQFS